MLTCWRRPGLALGVGEVRYVAMPVRETGRRWWFPEFGVAVWLSGDGIGIREPRLELFLRVLEAEVGGVFLR
jgi:hypothetical protein